jgi:hypothetical protein
MSTPQRGAEQGEDQTLGEELPDDAPAIRAERGPNGNLALSGRAARQQQVRDVGARNQEHERDRAREDEKGGPVLARQLFVERNDARAPACVARRKLRRERSRDGCHLGLRLRDGEPRFQSAERLEIPPACLTRVRVDEVRRPQVRRFSRQRSRLEERKKR